MLVLYSCVLYSCVLYSCVYVERALRGFARMCFDENVRLDDHGQSRV